MGVRLFNGRPERAHTIAHLGLAITITGKGVVPVAGAIDDEYLRKRRLLRGVNAGCSAKGECGDREENHCKRVLDQRDRTTNTTCGMGNCFHNVYLSLSVQVS